MTHPSPPADPEFQRWACLTWLLSMDVVVPFSGMMGLDPASAPTLRDVLRREIVDVRKEARARPQDAPHFRPARTAAAVERALGPGYRAGLERWAARVFAYSNSDGGDLDQWDWLLRHCRNSAGLWAAVGFPPAVRDEARRQFVASLDLADYRDVHAETYARPLSDWDLHLYATFLLNDDPEYGITDGPDDYVGPTVRNRRSYDFWAWVRGNLTADEVDQLWTSASAVVVKERLTSIPALPHPRTFEPIP